MAKSYEQITFLFHTLNQQRQKKMSQILQHQ